MTQEIDITIDTGNAKDISVELKGSGSQNIPTELEKVVDYEKTKNKPLFIGRTDKFNSRLAITEQTEDEVVLYEGGDFAFYEYLLKKFSKLKLMF